MTTVCSTYIFVSKQFLGLQNWGGYGLGIAVFAIACVWFAWWKVKKSSTCSCSKKPE